jgi:HAE1 family hydrophobic/amphiphilic exporter-1
MLEVDQEAAAQKGVNVLPAMDNLQTLLGSFYATNFIRFGQMYKVMVQVDPRYRAHPDDVLKFYAKNKAGEMVPYSSFVKMKRVYGPEQFTRYNMFTSAMVNGEPAPGFSSGAVLDIIRTEALKSLPRGYTLEWSGMTREEDLAGNLPTIRLFIASRAIRILPIAVPRFTFPTDGCDGHLCVLVSIWPTK